MNKQEINWDKLRKLVEEDGTKDTSQIIEEEVKETQDLLENGNIDLNLDENLKEEAEELEEVGKELQSNILTPKISTDNPQIQHIPIKTPKYKVWRILRGFLAFLGVLFLFEIGAIIFILIKFPNLITFS